MWRLALVVFIGSGIGGVVRFLVAKLVEFISSEWLRGLAWLPAMFPLATILVNVVGCFLIGLIYGAVEQGTALSDEARMLLTVGFCGGLTTFSTFTHEWFALVENGNFVIAAIYVALSIVCGFIAAWAGHAVVG